MDIGEIEPEDVLQAKTVIKEWNTATNGGDKEEITESEMKIKAPICWKILQHEAKDARTSVELYLKDNKMTLNHWFDIQCDYSEDMIDQTSQKQQFDELYQTASAELSILADKPRASFERHQATLDNQLYRAKKELRQLQDRRLSIIETLTETS